METTMRACTNEELHCELDERTLWGRRDRRRKKRSTLPRDIHHEAQLLSLDSVEVAEWISSDDEDDEEGDKERQHEPQHSTTLPKISALDEAKRRSRPLSALESLDPDTSASILHHLSVQEIVQLATVSKAMYQATHNSQLWQIKFNERWNFDASSMDWFQAYQQAYWNTDDLWITHWNCVEPTDGLGPGRCCIRDDSSKTIGNDNDPRPLCPWCRYHPTISPMAYNYPQSIVTRAQAIAAATRVRLSQHQKLYHHCSPLKPYSKSRAKRAFAKAATLHRHLSTHQYESGSLHFLTDLLFFQVHHDDDIDSELQDMKSAFSPDDTNHHVASETALHSWHLCHFTNPDYKRPVVWRISIMRKDCFTVYPSEGFLAPGQSQVVVFGVRPLGSLLAHATQQLNAHREGVDAFWANVYTDEAHLPPAPFLIHYHFATERQTASHDDARGPPLETPPHDPTHHVGNVDLTTTTRSTPWQRSGKPEQPVRIMYLSAHVNVEYSLDQFRRHCLVPFSLKDRSTLAFCAPQLTEFRCAVTNSLERLHLEGDNDLLAAHTYRTEGPCSSCAISWGPRAEELGQAFVVGRLESSIQQRKHNASFQKIRHVLALLIQSLQHHPWTERHHQVCVEIHRRLVDTRAIPWLSRRQRQRLYEWESITDLLCLRFTPLEDLTPLLERPDYFMIPWRHAGVYQNVLCTGSVFELTGFSLPPALKMKVIPTLWKDEPKYLEAFAHLAHSPGRFCLGPQEDPNHLRSASQAQASRYFRRQRGCVTDMFFDDPVCGLQAALCVVSDPRSLMVHGIWDRVPYPGTLVRRPKLLCLPPLQVDQVIRPTMLLSKFLSSPSVKLYYELQGSLDLECLLLVDSWCCNQLLGEQSDLYSLYPLSLRNYLQNIPPPGSGRFPLSTTVEDDRGIFQIQELEFSDDTIVDSSSLTSVTTSSQSQNVGRPTNPENDFQNHFNLAGLHQHRPAPRILNLLWVLSAHLGWTVDDNQGAASVYVDRRILIGAQWLSISLMAAPLFWTLVARYARWIPAAPVDYSLEALPFNVETELRFLSEHECGYVSCVLFFSWLCLGRWIERYTSRDFFRAMLEHLPSDSNGARQGRLRKVYHYLSVQCQRTWDSVCPLFLQRMVFVPNWNRRSRDDLMKHIAFWRSNQDQAASSTFRAISGGGFVVFDNRDGRIHLGEVSWSKKVFLSILVSLASFSASSPHFFLNLLTVFSSSISLGLSMSLQSMETGRAGVTVNETGSIVETLSLVTIVVLGFLVGQLVGSSGGVLFLAEFVVTSISLLLGGAGTISASAMESWGTFFCLAVTAFWGYLFGRVSIMEGIKQKRSGFSSIMLCFSLLVLAILWLIAMFGWKWESHIELVIDRPEVNLKLPRWKSKNYKQAHELVQ